MLSRFRCSYDCCGDGDAPAGTGPGPGAGAGGGAAACARDARFGVWGRFGVRGASSAVAPSDAPLAPRFNGDKLVRCDSCGLAPLCDGCGCCLSVAELPCSAFGSEPAIPMRAVGVRIFSLPARFPASRTPPRFSFGFPSGDALDIGSRALLAAAELTEGPAPLPGRAAATVGLVLCMRQP